MIRLIAALALVLTPPSLARTEDRGEQPVAPAKADEIVVTGRGLDAPPGTPSYGSVVIDRARLADAASGRLESALADVAGFQQFRRSDSRSSNPSAQGVTLRALGGNASSRALVLLDGVPIADPFFGFVPFSAIDPGTLASARITHGGGAGPFGAGALAGTIELTSAGADDLPTFAGRALYGSRDSTETAANVVAQSGAGFASLSGRYDRGDGFFTAPLRQRTANDIPARYDAWSTVLRGVVRVGDDSEVQARASLFDDQRTLRFAGADNASSGADASIRLVGRGDWQVEALAYVQTRNFRSRTVSSATGRVVLDQFNTPSTGLGGKLELRPPVGGTHVLRVGADVRRAEGQLAERNFNAATGIATQLRRAGGATTTTGLFIEDDWQLGKLVLTGGVRIDYWRIDRGFLRELTLPALALSQDIAFAARDGVRFSGRGGLVYAATDTLKLRAAAYSGFRLPTLNELYRPFRVFPDATAANAALRLEKLDGAEIGGDYEHGPFSLSVTGFYNRLSDAIANVTIAPGPGSFPQVGFVPANGVFRQRQNLDAIRVWGAEVNGGVRTGALAVSASYAFNHAEVIASGAGAALDRRRPAQSPRHAASATLGWTPAQGPSASLTLRHVSRQFEDDLESIALPPATTLDGVASIPLFAGVRLSLRGENLFDEEVVTRISGGVIERGTPRTLWIGLNFGG